MANPTYIDKNDAPSLGKSLGNIFHTFADLCEQAANTEANKSEGNVNRPAYFTARFFQLLFEATAFIADHITSWVSNPMTLVNDFASIFNFFFAIGKMFENWINELTGKKNISANNEEVTNNLEKKEEPKNSNTVNIKPIENRLTSTALLLNNSFGTYTKPAQELISEENNGLKTKVVLEENLTKSCEPEPTLSHASALRMRK